MASKIEKLEAAVMDARRKRSREIGALQAELNAERKKAAKKGSKSEASKPSADDS